MVKCGQQGWYFASNPLMENPSPTRRASELPRPEQFEYNTGLWAVNGGSGWAGQVPRRQAAIHHYCGRGRGSPAWE